MTRPHSLSKDFIQRVVSSKGLHEGIFQIQISKKKDAFYSVYISDGHFDLKTLFSKDAARRIERKELLSQQIVRAEVKTFNIEDGVYVVKEVIDVWDVAPVVGEPKEWKSLVVIANPKGKSSIEWERHANEGRSSRKETKSGSRKNIKSNQKGEKQQSKQKSKKKSNNESDLSKIPKSRSKSKTSKQQEKEEHQRLEQPLQQKETEEPKDPVTPKQRTKKGAKHSILKSKGKSKDKQSSHNSNKQNEISFAPLEENKILSPSNVTGSPGKKQLESSSPEQPQSHELEQDDFLLTKIKLLTKTFKSKINTHTSNVSVTKKDKPNPYNSVSPSSHHSRKMKFPAPLLLLPDDQPQTSPSPAKRSSKLLIQQVNTQGVETVNEVPRLSSPVVQPLLEQIPRVSKEKEEEDYDQLFSILEQESRMAVTVKQDSPHGPEQQVDSFAEIQRLLEEESRQIVATKAKIVSLSTKPKPLSCNPYNIPAVPEITVNEIHPSIGSNWTMKAQILCISPELTVTKTKQPNRFVILRDKEGNTVEVAISEKTATGELKEDSFFEVSQAEIDDNMSPRFKGCIYTITTTKRTLFTPIAPFPVFPNYPQVYTSLKELQCKSGVSALVNVIAVVKSSETSQYIKEGKTKYKGMFTLVDPLASLEIALIDFNGSVKMEKLTVVSLFNLKVSIYKDTYQLMTCANTIVRERNEDLEEVKRLGEFTREDQLENILPKLELAKTTIGILKSIELTVMAGGGHENDLKGEVRGKLVSYQRSKIYYLSCPVCRKKLIEKSKAFFCIKCETTKTPQARFLVSGLLSNHQGGIHCFLDEKLVQKIMGISAGDYYQLEKEGVIEPFNEYLINLERMMGKEVQAQLVGSVSVYRQRRTAFFGIKYMELVPTQQVFSDLLSQINNYVSLL